MAASTAATVEQYLAQLPDDRRAVVSRVRDVVRRSLPKGYDESMGFGMICYSVPLARYPNTYNGQPLGYVALAAQKNYYALYLTSVYQDPAQEARLREAFAAAGKKMDMGKSCLRFRRVEDLPLEAIGELLARTTPDDFIAQYEAARARAGRGTSAKPRAADEASAKSSSARKGAAKKTTTKKTTAKKTTGEKTAARKSAAQKTTARPAKKATSKRAASARRK